jgi:hypothetical protein
MDPRRLLEDHDDRFELRLLRSAYGDEAPEGSRERAAIALGLSVSGLAAATTARGATAAKSTLAVLSKWFGVGLVSGAVVTGSLHYTVTRAHPVKQAAVPVKTAPAARNAGPALAVAASTQPAIPTREVSAEFPPKKVLTTKRVSAAPVTAAPTAVEAPQAPQNDSLAAELALLGDARRALVAHDAAAVLAALAAYDAVPRTGVLDAEANMLRVEAWLQRGESARAVQLARHMLSANPASAHAVRLRHIVERAP